MKILVTGRVASGKDTVISLLNKKLGYFIIDADKIGHSLLNDKTIIQAIINFLPNTLDKGVINRHLLSDAVFSSKEILQKLNLIIHPKLISEINNQITTHHDNFIINAAIAEELDLLHKGLFIINVNASNKNIIDRLTGRGVKTQKAQNILDSQQKAKWYKSIANVTINNNGSKEDLEKEISKKLAL